MKRHEMKRHEMMFLAGLAGMNTLLGFVYSWFVITRLGTGRETDALYAGMIVPTLLVTVVSGSLTRVLVPLLATTEETAFGQRSWTFFVGIGLLFALLAAALALAAPFWVPLTTPGFDAATHELTIRLMRIQLVGMVFTALIAVQGSVYNARDRFLWVEWVTLFSLSVSLALLWFTLPRIGVTAAAMAQVAGVGVQLILLLPGMGPFRRPDWKGDAPRRAWRQMRPLLLGTIYYKTDPMIDRLLASMTPAGGLSLLQMATQMYGAGNQIIARAVVGPMTPRLARQADNADWAGFHALASRRLGALLLLSGGVFVGLLLFGQPLLRIAYGHGRVSPESIQTLWVLLIALSGTWIGGIGGQVTATSFYARGNTNFPTRLGVWTYSFYVPLKILAAVRWGLLGIAVSTSLFTMLNFVTQGIVMQTYLKKQRAIRDYSSVPHTSIKFKSAKSGAYVNQRGFHTAQEMFRCRSVVCHSICSLGRRVSTRGDVHTGCRCRRVRLQTCIQSLQLQGN
jgi:putative peptidoglycan lipid II flippase